MGEMHNAARNGDLVELTKLLSTGSDVNARDKLSRTPLHLAAWAGQVCPAAHSASHFSEVPGHSQR